MDVKQQSIMSSAGKTIGTCVAHIYRELLQQKYLLALLFLALLNRHLLLSIPLIE